MRFTKLRTLLLTAIMASLLTAGAGPLLFHSAAAKLPNRSLQLSDPTQGASTQYQFSFDIDSTDSIGSIRFQFCSDTPLVDYPCTAPDGLDVTGAALSSQNGETGFSVDPKTTANELFLTRTPSATSVGTSRYVFTGVVNPSATGTYFARIQTYGSTDGTGTSVDDGGLAFVINNAIDISSTVPPYLLFCNGLTIDNYDCSTVSGDYINFGELSASTTKVAKSQMVIATNAGNGYNVLVDGATLASGTDVIPGVPTNDVSRPGTSQFGINLAANTTPAIGEGASGPGTGTVVPAYAIADRFHFIPGDQLVAANGVNDYRKFTVSYIVNRSKDQASGVYVSTFTYVCLANF